MTLYVNIMRKGNLILFTIITTIIIYLLKRISAHANTAATSSVLLKIGAIEMHSIHPFGRHMWPFFSAFSIQYITASSYNNLNCLVDESHREAIRVKRRTSQNRIYAVAHIELSTTVTEIDDTKSQRVERITTDFVTDFICEMANQMWMHRAWNVEMPLVKCIALNICDWA